MNEPMFSHRLSLIACCLLPAVAMADAPLRVLALQPQSSVFAGESIQRTFEIQTSASQPFSGAAVWSFAARGRTLARGEAILKADPKQPGKISLALTTPSVNGGLGFDVQLRIDVLQRAGEKPLAEFTQTLWVWSREPFANRRQWLRTGKIHLFDPQHHTAEVFQAADIPFEAIERASALRRCDSGWIVIGAGVAYGDHPTLVNDLIEAVARGVEVLCLTPELPTRSGQTTALTLPLHPSSHLVEQISFRRQHVIQDFDKRFDLPPWRPSQRVSPAGMSLTSSPRNVQAQYTNAADAWPWLEIVYRHRSMDTSSGSPDGRLIVCGFPIIENWDDHPTPRYLLAKILSP